ncbi:TrkH family potassium uptake protein [Modestobacter italicus]|uniref:TrkH family potassium uptake protein n=1 Tax=Modestobacter italicus (strain DSM 44449 / CECT 9708 / BC 501) TaxID=2732864 RepID=UPI001C968209|nr:potassium transporter TrkG [Modestobacter italicus]
MARSGGSTRSRPSSDTAGSRRLRGLHVRFRHPAQAVVAAFAAAVAVGTGLLSLPGATAGPARAGFMEALFTATSSVCVTGLITVDTPTYWSGFGQAVILGLIQVGGFGIMTLASVLALLLARRLGLRARLNAAAETKSLGVGDIRQLLIGVAKASLLFESVVAVLLTARFALGYDEPLPRALWLGVFHSVSAFNNAGFALYSDSLMSFVTDPWICLPIVGAVIAGGLGFPVLLQLRREFRTPRTWTMNTRLVLAGTAALLLLGTVFLTALEWRNPDTLGPLSVPGKLLAGFTAAVMPRTAGFNNLDIAAMEPASWLGMDLLMFIGGGPAGTAGGIKVTTFLVLFFIIYTEVRGEGAVNVFGKRLPRSVHRQATTVALLSLAAVMGPTIVLLVITPFTLDQVLFEVVSAFATVGLSTGITADLPVAGQLLLVALMFIGRLGPITLASALALRQHTQLYELPKERPVIG